MLDKGLTEIRFASLINKIVPRARVPSRALAHLLALLLAAPALAQPAPQPQATVTLDPDGPVTVGTPVIVTVTLLVPSYMPEPPVWPDLEIADAVTRLPERATHPVTRRFGRESWSGIARTWEIVPQRPAAYDLGGAEATVTYADPDTNAPVEATVALPGIAFTATVPPGAEGIDPFLAATSLTLAATVNGLANAPAPGDAFTLTLTTTASGPPAMLLPPIADRLPDLPGLRAYPRQPVLADGDPASRTEAVAYVIEAPGSYVLPALSLDWWNTATASRETATTEPLTIDVATPAGWRAETAAPNRRPLRIALAALAVTAALLAGLLLRRRRGPRPPSPAALRRALLRSARADPPDEIRRRLAGWQAALPAPLPPRSLEAIDAALRRLDRATYGPPGATAVSDRSDLLAALEAARPLAQPASPPLPPLNPPLPGT
jgi:hypothetical protein